MRDGLFSGLLSMRGLILGLGLCLEIGVTLSAFFWLLLVWSNSPLVSPLARGEVGGGDSERDSLRLKHIEEFSLEESWMEQSSDGGRGMGEGHASGGGRSSHPSKFSMSYGKFGWLVSKGMSPSASQPS